MADIERLPSSLVDLLATSVILRQIAPYISLKGLISLSRTSKTIRSIVISEPEPWRHLDLSDVKSAVIRSSPIDVGGISWKAERMDEALTEDDFYSGPLRRIFNQLQRRNILRNVQTLILDGLSVPAELVREIITEDRFSVKILSIREAENLNQRILQQALHYVVRPTRAAGTPRLKALYFFGPKDSPRSITSREQHISSSSYTGGVMTSEGAQIGAAWNQRSSDALDSSLLDDEMRWYGCTGRAMKRPLSDWPDTLRACKGLIAFDAVLCRGPRHDITKVDSKDFLQPTIATVALGSTGCEICRSCPEGPAIFGVSDETTLPLLSPPPTHASTVKAAQRPQPKGDTYPRLILRCEDCLRSRWCERCNRWWCEDCYREPATEKRAYNDPMQQLDLREQVSMGGWESVSRQVYEGSGPQIKVYSRLCTENCLVSEMMSGSGSNGMW